MIDLDRLDEGLERAMTDELRTLRGITPAWARPPKPAPEEATASAQVPPAPTSPPQEWDDELWEEAGFEAGPRPKAPTMEEPARPAPRPRPLRVDVAFEKRPAAPAMPAAAEPGPEPAPAPTPADQGRVAALMTQGLVAEADQEIARAGTPMEWRIMRALLDGRRNEACASLRLVTKLGRGDRFWFQRFWVALEWGDDAEQGEVLDHCRERAYRFGELPWRGALTLHLARLGRHDEAARELQTTLAGLDSCHDDQVRLDIVTTLIEAAYLLGDAKAAEALGRRLPAAAGTAAAANARFVVVGPGWVCKGSIARYQALAAAAQGQWKLADERFSAAADAHQEIGAQPLLARTLLEWGRTVQHHDAARAHRYIDHGVGIADSLRLTGLANQSRSPAMAS